MAMHVDTGDESTRRWQEERRQAALDLIRAARRFRDGGVGLTDPEFETSRDELNRALTRAERVF